MNPEPNFRLKQMYDLGKLLKSDINEHLPTLKEYSRKCSHVTEFGCGKLTATYALLNGCPETMVSYDITPLEDFGYRERGIKALAHNTNYFFFEKDVLTASIDRTDFLFIDTVHTYEQISKELKRHHKKVMKYIGIVGTMKGGMKKAIQEFLLDNPNWVVELEYTNNNGLIILNNKGLD